MKRMLITSLIFMTFMICLAPKYKSFPIIIQEGIQMYDPLIKAINWVEVQNGEDLYNELEGAVGWFQIRQCRVDDYNKRVNSNYKLEDFYDYELSKKMFLYYAQGKTFEKAAKDWNGSGPMTLDYWKKVKSKLPS